MFEVLFILRYKFLKCTNRNNIQRVRPEMYFMVILNIKKALSICIKIIIKKRGRTKVFSFYEIPICKIHRKIRKIEVVKPLLKYKF